MMKNYFFLLSILLTKLSFAQVGIGNTNPHPSALLDIRDASGDNKGILIPRVSLTTLNSKGPISNTPLESLLVYNTNASIKGGKGFYYWQGGSWNHIIADGDIQNLYTTDGTLAQPRTVNQGANPIQFSGDVGRNALIIKRTQNNTTQGIGFQNSGNYYDATIHMESGTRKGLILSSGGNQANINSVTPTLTLNDDNSLTLNAYGGTNFTTNNPPFLLSIENDGRLTQFNSTAAYTLGNHDWYKENTTNAPDAITNNIYTNGEVGINITNPNAPLHINEATGTTASATEGTMILEHGNAGGESSIVFKSASNSGSDYGFIKYQDNRSGNSTDHNSLLTIGVENDDFETYSQYQDDINISSSGSVGINTNAPNGSASLHLGASDRGLLINKVPLTSLTDAATVGNNNPEPDGLLVYNTNTAPSDLEEGFYFWQAGSWHLLLSDITKTATPPTAPTGLQYYSYNIPVTPSPNLGDIRTNTLIAKSDGYNGNLDSASALPTMKPSNTDGYVIKVVGTYTVINPGTFNLSSTSNNTNDGTRLYVDDSLVINEWDDTTGNAGTGTVTLREGKHRFEFWYYQSANTGNFSFSWGTSANPDGNSGVMNADQFTIE